MKSIAVTDNLTQLIKFGLINAYLVREDDGFTLIDTAMSAADEIIAAATAAGGPIVRIALTHGHGDHVGSLDALKEKLGPTVPVLMSETDAKILAGGEVAPPAKKRGSWPKLKTTPDSMLSAGERIGSLEVVPAPGHTPGQLAFRDTRDNALIVGDAFFTVGGCAVPSHLSWKFPLPYGATCDRPQALATAKALAQLDPTLLAAGHGSAIASPQAAIAKAIRAAGG